MKKVMMMLAMVCMAVVVSAQDVVGTWFAAEEDNSMSMMMNITLKEDQRASFDVQVVMPQEAEGMQMLIYLNVSMPAKWTMKKEVVTVKFDKKEKPTFNVDVEIPGLDEGTLNLVKAMVQKEMEGQRKELEKEMLKELNGEKFEMSIGYDNGEMVMIAEGGVLHRK